MVAKEWPAFDHVLMHGYFGSTVKPDYDRHVALVDQAHRASVLHAAYARGMEADYDAHIRPIRDERERCYALMYAYGEGGLVPDFDAHLAGIADDDNRRTAFVAAAKAGLAADVAEAAALAVPNETLRARFLGELYEAKVLKCDLESHFYPLKRSTPRACLLAAAYRHGGLQERFPVTWFTNEKDLAIVLRAALEAGVETGFDPQTIECAAARSSVWTAAYLHGRTAPDFEGVIRPFLGEQYRTSDIERYRDVLIGAYQGGGLKADYDLHIAPLKSKDAAALCLYHAYKFGGLVPDYDIHILPLRSELLYGLVLKTAYECGLVPDFFVHLAHVGDSRAFATAFEHGLEPRVSMLIAVRHDSFTRKLVLCAMYDTGKVAPEYAHLQYFQDEFDRAWILEHAYKAGLKPDFDLHVAPMKQQLVKALALCAAVELGGMAMEPRFAETFSDERAIALLPQSAQSSEDEHDNKLKRKRHAR
jgi:hypothetical protein